MMLNSIKSRINCFSSIQNFIFFHQPPKEFNHEIRNFEEISKNKKQKKNEKKTRKEEVDLSRYPETYLNVT